MTLENYAVREMSSFPHDGLTGRRKIKTSVREITRDNVREVLGKALYFHALNAAEITYLWDYYRGKQDIRSKTKFVRENINNRVTVNKASEIVTFKTAYLLNEPIQYVSHGDSEETFDQVIQLNEYMRAEDKDSKDKEIVDWVHICGVGERLILSDKMAGEINGAPFYIYTLDPREAFVIYSSQIGQRPLAGVILQKDENEKPFAQVYTKNRCFTVTKDDVKEEGHVLGGVPLIEYTNNAARMGAFENVISILNSINQLESDAVDSIQDFVNGFDVFQNCEIDQTNYKDLSIGGQAVMVKTVMQGMEAKVYRVASEINQAGVQQRIDDLTQDYLTIAGMPNRNGGSSTSDTGQAVIFRDGWSEAESRAKDSEKLFTAAERQFLRIALNICAISTPLNLELKDIGVNFTRKSLNNLQSKLQGLCELLANDYVHPVDAYNALGDVFGDKTAAYKRGMAWHEEQERKAEDELNAELDRERTYAVQASRRNNEETEQDSPEKAGQDKASAERAEIR